MLSNKLKTQKNISEKAVEQKLVRAVKSIGGICPKLVSPGMDGMPDRLVLLQGGKAVFCETKAPGKHLRPLQVKRKQQLESLGFDVYVIDGIDRIGEMIDDIHSA